MTSGILKRKGIKRVSGIHMGVFCQIKDVVRHDLLGRIVRTMMHTIKSFQRGKIKNYAYTN